MPRLIRRIADPLTRRIPVRIIGGVNRGAKWSLASAGSGYRSGRREAAQMELLASLIRPADVVWDVGAHHGYVTLLASARVGPAGVVHAFEPGASNREILERHLRWNRRTNVVVHDCALGAYDGDAQFGGGGTSKQARLGAGSEVVRVRTVGSLLSSGDASAPDFVKIDVEGAEADVLANGLRDLPPHARLLVAVHSAEVYTRCVRVLRDAGFALLESERLRRHRVGQWRGDADLFCIGPARAGAEAEADRRVLAAAGYV